MTIFNDIVKSLTQAEANINGHRRKIEQLDQKHSSQFEETAESKPSLLQQQQLVNESPTHLSDFEEEELERTDLSEDAPRILEVCGRGEKKAGTPRSQSLSQLSSIASIASLPASAATEGEGSEVCSIQKE